MNLSRPHYRLDAWKESLKLAKLIYELSQRFPDSERYGLVSQMRRAAVSVLSNIAEGAARNSRKEFAQFLSIAQGSLSELEAQVIISQELGYIADSAEVLELLDRVSRLVGGLQRSLR
ncbi:four helix bundle protein [Candidatus Berkelbacteria bacterium]|nr:four helix bundle protein [Candidatus Berkelbacteria bacterium]